ncbi:sterol desaturase family protein [Lichenicoccus roseus]|uniref:Sterol desaturase family protein n=1 Tax=Lichenicoccus roseus TaxID=2683649 RepID=A0A5R9J5Q6_9PROT|nr:sterol desaturase family protein [Lichenicoccus roseus]TLU72183.1 sterol desaturase family protein [Lichenicoccus roseus]
MSRPRPAIASAVACLAILVAERVWPLRRLRQPVLVHEGRNLVMGALCAAVVAGLEAPITDRIARDNMTRRRGFGQRLPRPLGKVAAFLAMDYGFYLWHVATHRLAPLWRFHRVHHVDADLSLSTALRFHLVDMLVSLPWRMVQVRVSGIDPDGLAAWRRFFTLSILFHHSNWRLPGEWDRRLAWVLTTPRMHGIHHSVGRIERDSNWSSGLSLWDRLHRTMRLDVPQSTPVTGIDDPAAVDDMTLWGALRAPFRSMPSPERYL